LIYHSIDSTIKHRKIEELVDLPKVVLVNKFDEESAKNFRHDFTKAINTGQKVIPVVIDSFGGEVYSLMSMVATIQSSPVKVATISTGKSMSCGSILLSCGEEGMRYIDPAATVMIHDVANMAWGKIEDLKASTAEADRLNQIVFKLMAKNCGKDDDYFFRLIDEAKHADLYLDAKACKHHNLANHIRFPSFKVKVSSEVSFS
jgi:ATP-dependent protease ClpP protease subunit